MAQLPGYFWVLTDGKTVFTGTLATMAYLSWENARQHGETLSRCKQRLVAQGYRCVKVKLEMVERRQTRTDGSASKE